MGNRVITKRGNEANMPLLAAGELAFATNTKKLFVGTGSQNIAVNGNFLEMDASGNVKMTGNLTLKSSSAYGNKINFGDGDYVHISEPANDTLELKGTRIKMYNGSTEVVKIEGDKAYINGVEVNTAEPSFDFDNLFGFPGCKRITVKENNTFKEIIQTTAGSKKIAERQTTRTSSGYTEAIKIFEQDGVTLKKTFIITTIKTATGFEERVIG